MTILQIIVQARKFIEMCAAFFLIYHIETCQQVDTFAFSILRYDLSGSLKISLSSHFKNLELTIHEVEVNSGRKLNSSKPICNYRHI